MCIFQSVVKLSFVLLSLSSASNIYALSDRQSAELPPGSLPAVAEQLAKNSAEIYAPVQHQDSIRIGNPPHNIQATFHKNGVQLNIHNTVLKMRLSALGREKLAEVKAVAPQIDGVKVVYNHEQLQQWYINSPLGLEQGFTLLKKPAGNGQLNVALELGSDYHAEINQQQLQFKDPQGKIKLNYGQLVAFDSHGKTLPGTMHLSGNRLVLTVDDKHASYPIIIDPLFSYVTPLVVV